MGKITYKRSMLATIVQVFLDGKRVGQIAPSPQGGYRYNPAGGNFGESFPTIEEVKKSLGAE